MAHVTDTAFDRVLARTLAFVAVIAVAFAGVRPLWEPDEGRYAEVAREMIQTGEFVVPHLGPAPHLTKPPLTYWLTTVGIRVFGVNPWGVRIPVVLAFLVTAWCVFDIARSMGLGQRLARLSALVYLTSILPFVAGHVLTCDTFVTAFQTLSIAAAWRVWTSELTVRWSWVHSLALAAAFLTKGPPGLLPVLVVVSYAVVRRDRRVVGRLWLPAPCIAGVATSIVWFVVLAIRDPSSLRYFLGGELVEHLTSAAGKTPEPAWIYVPILAAGALPWSLSWWRLARSTFRAASNRSVRCSDPMLFVAVWFAVPLAVFMAARSRMALYVLPSFAPLAIAMARELLKTNLERWFVSRTTRAVVGVAAVTWSVVLVVSMVAPDAAPGSRSYAAFCDRIRALDGTTPVKCWSVRRFSIHSIEFELDRVIERRAGSTHAVAREMLLAAGDGSPRVLLLTAKQARSLLERQDADPPGSAFVVVAARRGMVAVQPSGRQ